jgi:hypothetical protein
MKRGGYRVAIPLFLVLAICSQLCWTHRSFSQEAGKTLKLDGQSDGVAIPHASHLDIAGPFTIEAWFTYHSGSSRQSVLVAKGATQDKWLGYALFLDNEGHLGFFSGRGTQSLRSSVALCPDQWYHVACVLRGERTGQAEIWINGFLDRKGALEFPFNTHEGLSIGQWGDAFNHEGEIDEVRIYNRALPKEEIESHMGVALTGSENELLAYYPFNELTSDGKVKDLSPYGHNGQLQGDATLVGSDAPLFSSNQTMGAAAERILSRTETRLEQLKIKGVRIPSLLDQLIEAKSRINKQEYNAAFRYAWAAQATLEEIWNLLQEYTALRKEVEEQIHGLKKDRMDVSIFERELSEAEDALRDEKFMLASKLIGDTRSNIDKARRIFPRIEELSSIIEEIETLGCDAGEAKKKMKTAMDVFNTGGYSRVEEHVQDGIALAQQADCGKVKIMNVIAQAAKYNGKTIEIKGQIKNIESVYASGHKIAVDDGTGLIWVEYQGSMKNIEHWKDLDYLDTVIIEGIFNEENAFITANKVR